MKMKKIFTILAVLGAMMFLFAPTGWAGVMTQDIVLEAIGAADQLTDQIKGGSNPVAVEDIKANKWTYVLSVQSAQKEENITFQTSIESISMVAAYSRWKNDMAALTFIYVPAQAREEGIILNDIILANTRLKSSLNPANHTRMARISGTGENTPLYSQNMGTAAAAIIRTGKKGHPATIVLSLSSANTIRAYYAKVKDAYNRMIASVEAGTARGLPLLM